MLLVNLLFALKRSLKIGVVFEARMRWLVVDARGILYSYVRLKPCTVCIQIVLVILGSAKMVLIECRLTKMVVLLASSLALCNLRACLWRARMPSGKINRKDFILRLVFRIES